MLDGFASEVQMDFICSEAEGGPQGRASDLCRCSSSQFPAGAAVVRPATRANACSHKVSQLPSGRWAHFDRGPAAHPPHPHPPQMDGESGQIAAGLKSIFH